MIVAVASELGALSRFDNTKQLMYFPGLTPSEYSSGGRTSRGHITKTGNGHVRRTLIEAAWCYRYPAYAGDCQQSHLSTLSESTPHII